MSLRSVLFVLVALVATPARADTPREADFRHWQDYFWFAGGAASAFIVHEVSHLTMDLFAGKTVKVEKVKLGPFPFFSLTACCNLSRQEEYAIASAGFVSQNISSELILWMTPRLRAQRHAFLKGVLMFDVALSLGYAITGFGNLGPPSSDVQSMARALQMQPWKVGVALTIPAVVDFVRYFFPDWTWAPYVSLGSKTMMAGAFVTF